MRELILNIGGLTCSSCIKTVTKALNKEPCVTSCNVSLTTCEAIIIYNENKGKINDIIESIKKVGFEALKVTDTNLNRINKFSVEGMTCGGCTSKITTKLMSDDDIYRVDVSLITQECEVEFNPQAMDSNKIQELIENCGFNCSIIASGDGEIESRLRGGDPMRRTALRIFNFDYYKDVDLLKEQLEKLEQDILIENVDDERGVIAVQYDSSKIGIRSIFHKVEELGFQVILDSPFDNSTQIKLLSKIKETKFWKMNCLISGIFGIILLMLYMWIPFLVSRFLIDETFPYNESLIKGLFYRDIFGFLIATYVQFYIGKYFYIKAFNSIKHCNGTMDTLVCISTSCAYIFSVYSIIKNIIIEQEIEVVDRAEIVIRLPNVNFTTSIMLFAFISFGKYLEQKAKSKTSTALKNLMSLTPSSCFILDEEDNMNLKEIPVDLLQDGDLINVSPGMKVPVDGIITYGESEVDESLMTGESVLVKKTINDDVIAGSINGPGTFIFRATHVGDETKLSFIIKTMKQAQLIKAPIQRYADYLASLFVPIIILLAFLTFCFWFFVSQYYKGDDLPNIFQDEKYGNFYVCLRISISVIVVACPCALGLATPTAVMVGTGMAAENGVLIKGGDKLEIFNKIKTIIFDKTGTITTGKMKVIEMRFKHSKVENDYYGENEYKQNEEYLIKCLILLTRSSEHPVSKAIYSYLCERYPVRKSGEIEMIESKYSIGNGIKGKFEIKGVSEDLVEIGIGQKTLYNNEEEYDDDKENDYTRSYVFLQNKVVAIIELNDQIKRDSYETIEYLKNRNYNVFMISGDNRRATMKVSEEIGIPIDHVFSEVLPIEKCNIIKDIKKNWPGNEYVAFVGDGINDSPSLATSDLGISISSGTDVAIDTADIVILSNEESNSNTTIKEVCYALDISKATFATIKRNLFWATIYNILMIPISMGALSHWGITLDPMLAGLAMAMSSVCVVLSSLRLKRWKPPVIGEENALTSKDDLVVFGTWGNYLRHKLGTSWAHLRRAMGSSHQGRPRDPEAQLELIG
ncbi:hypothetical protein TBLA_0A09560 [Henningerozyma blattae CBS 6284]|uniref:P-type Cu(+) transporter n=1 Tax=Henningerozyma blattae (strain ATCC 34711 / CBS 6284 / DSM 70876 / NBRC 10599 / NRRL Y-10934 / UCD 77-7) TaxID=1071380 RepID=I2GX88_HENB6|nr:hypothetical protein TBLA_0A09560 [Tetrapisispora blattae CBS 6284]CCH58740.1 hypothetical protein TBLA_0A09560 [Tetrapisispora blattae CBS 6284]